MKQILRLQLLVMLLLPFWALAEGSKQLTPNTTGTTANLADHNNTRAGFLAHDANFPSQAGVSASSLSFLKPRGYSYNGATYSEDHRLYVRVLPGEQLHYGVHRTLHDQGSGNQGDLIITVRYRKANGTEVLVGSTTLTRDRTSSRHMLLANSQDGVIETAQQAQNGPAYKAGANGYRSLSVTNEGAAGDVRDYFFEFTQTGESAMSEGQRFSVYDFWDFTVYDAGKNEKPGRLYSKLWSFSAGGTNNVFSKNFNMYPLIPSEDQADRYYVKKLELAGIAPQNFFRFVTNRYGADTNVGSTIEARRKSQNAQRDYPEFNNFVNNPDQNIWPSATAPEFNVSSTTTCNTNTGGGKVTFSAYSSERSTFLVLVNLNGQTGYQPGTTDVLLELNGPKGNKTIEWNGLNGRGEVVAKKTSVQYYFKNASAAVHFPMWDAETNVGGFRVEDVRPLAGSNYNGELYWDDSNLSTTAFPAPQSELFGVASSGGVHGWGNTTNNTLAGDLKLVNTWTYGYTNSKTESTTFEYDCSADVGVTQTVSAGPYTTTKPVTYTIVVTNYGPVAATGVSVTDKLDATKLQFISASDAAYNSSTGIWTIGTLAVGASKTLTLTAQPKVIGDIVTTATKASSEQDNVATNNSQSVTISVVSAADIQVLNTVPKTTYNNGEVVPYTLKVKNLGPSAATGVAITDKLPDGLTLEGAAPAGYNASTGIWTVGNLAVNEERTLILNAKASKLGTITTTASLNDRSAHQLDENSSNNTSANTITVGPSADVEVSSAVSNNVPKQNQVVTFTITAKNNGPNNATNVVLTNAVPAGLQVVSQSITAGSFNSSNNTWTVGSIPSGTTHTLQLVARAVAVGTHTVTSAQTHTENDAVVANNSASSSVTVSPTADVAVTNTISPVKASYANGESVTYTIVVTNNGPSAATNVSVLDKLPASLTIVNPTSASKGSYDTATGTWTVGSLASGASETLTLRATINQSAVITTTATQSHTEYDDVNGNNSASNSIRSGSGTVTADINVEVTASTAQSYTGENITFTTRLTNTGPDAATNLALSARIPAGMSLVSATPKIGTYDSTTGRWTVGQLASGTYTELIMVLRANSDTSAPGDKTYTVTANELVLTESQGSDVYKNTDSKAVVVSKSGDLKTSISVTGDVGGVYYNGLTEATFTLTVTNNGPDRLTNLVGRDTRTGAITFTSTPVASDGSTYNPTTGEWRIPSLEVGASTTLVVKGKPNTTGRLFLGGEKTSQDQHDPNLSNDKAIALIEVAPVAELEVTNTVAAGPYYTGQNTTFTVKVKNNGPDAATGVKIQDKLPAGLEFVSYTSTAGTYDAATGIWTLGTNVLPGGANAQSLILTVKPTSTANYITTASVSTAGEYDGNTANNSQSASVQASAAADITVSSTIVSGPYYIGEKYQLTLTASNLGPDAATGVEVRNVLSEGLLLDAGSTVTDAGTSYDAATGVWTIGNLANNQSKRLTLTVSPATSDKQTFTSTKIAANEHDINGGNTANGNNIYTLSFSVTDRPAVLNQLVTSKHFLSFSTGELLATFADPDGVIENATLVNMGGNLPAGIELHQNGDILVRDKHAIKPGDYTLTIKTIDAEGGSTEQNVTYTITNDWDNDGINDADDIDDNNDGITDIISGNGVDPLGDDDGDGKLNYHDRDFIHPVYGVFRDINNDDVNDVFDMDLDRRINSLDADIDGDGIANVLEANSGKIPEGNIYAPNSGTITGPVSANGMPVAAQTTGNSGIAKFDMPDSDGDSFMDFMDLDADNDGILDNLEAQTTDGFINKVLLDSDRDGINDAYDPDHGGQSITPVDTDGDKIPDYLDLDSDDDEAPDFEEAFDDDRDGFAQNDMIIRAARFEESMGVGYYTDEDKNKNKVPDWLDKIDGKPAYLVPESGHYYDTDQDGFVDLLDTDAGGRPAALQRTGNEEYDFRDQATITPLPVTLAMFRAKVAKNGVLLEWSTATEINNDRFVLERSLDGKLFNAIGWVKGVGNSNATLKYKFLDATVPSGVTYYRLKQLDFDGKYEYSTVVSVNVSTAIDNQSRKGIVYPNPTSGIVTLNLSALPEGDYNLTVFGINGKQVRQLVVKSQVEQQLDLSNLAVGKYVVRIQGADFVQHISLILK
ncbi:T9SS type A sorting domain-containing protein [Pontibacter oryzae]|nr:T9SS type A sorting domain-containing protein [Pontibacter oryzae]